MTDRTDDTKRARAEAVFRRREQQKADAPLAMHEYREAFASKLRNMQRLKKLREARDAAAT
jgi:hypothetical protein